MSDPGPMDPLVFGNFCVFFFWGGGGGGGGRRGGGSTTSFDYFVGYLFSQLFLKVRASQTIFVGEGRNGMAFCLVYFVNRRCLDRAYVARKK